MSFRRFIFLGTSFLPILFVSCGKGNGSQITSSFKAANNVTDLTSGQFLQDPFGLSSGMDRLAVGQNGATDLTSLKYFITAIDICQGMTLNGSGFTNPTGCIEIMKFASDDRFTYDTTKDYSNLAAVARTADDKFTNLLDATSRAKLATTTTLTRLPVAAPPRLQPGLPARVPCTQSP